MFDVVETWAWPGRLDIKVRYGKSEQLRYVDGHALAPIGYVKHRNPMHKRRIINSYTPEGREAIHTALGKNINTVIMHYLMRNPIPYPNGAVLAKRNF